VQRIFGLTRAPFKDVWHAINYVTKTCHEGLPLQRQQFAAELSNALRAVDQADLNEVVNYLRKERKMTLRRALVEALKNYRSYGTIRVMARDRQEMLRLWDTAIERWTAERDRAAASKQRCIIRHETVDQDGTIESMQSVRWHIAQGCLGQPLPYENLYVELGKQPLTGLPKRLYTAGSSCCESRNRVLNKIVASVSRMNSDLATVYLDFAIYLANRQQDIVMGRTDAHHLGFFSSDDVDLNAEAAKLLEGEPLFPCAASSSSLDGSFPSMHSRHNLSRRARHAHSICPAAPLDGTSSSCRLSVLGPPDAEEGRCADGKSRMYRCCNSHYYRCYFQRNFVRINL
jgi:hypothetical protein